jgi:enoyl-CoA hydratase/carnithine racemase
MELSMNPNPVRVQVPAILDDTSIGALHTAVEAAADRSAGMLVLHGTSGTFCGGLDLERLADEPDVAAPVHTFARCIEALRLAPCATIALVDGPALGGGLGLAAACDVVVATPRAAFGLPELLFGLLPAIVLPVVLERVSAQRLRLVALRAQTLSAHEALQIGLADEVVNADDLPGAVRRWWRALTRADTSAVALLKRHAVASLSAGFERGAALTAERLQDAAVLATVRRFADGEVAPWLV